MNGIEKRVTELERKLPREKYCYVAVLAGGKTVEAEAEIVYRARIDELGVVTVERVK